MHSALQTGTVSRPPAGDEGLPYLLSGPSSVDGEDRWPLVLFLHGSDERGADLELVASQGLPKLVDAGREFPFFMVAPQCPGHSTWACELTVLSTLLDEVAAAYPVDPDRVYVTGLSMGGIGTWAIATRYPDRFAAAAPICGGWLPEAAPRLHRVPVWTFHGEDDTVVPISETEKMVAALRDAGGDVRFTRYPGVDHDSWTRTYDNPELYDWLAGHRRNG